MSRKERKEKLGRNPFEQKKSVRKHKSYEELQPVQSERAAQEDHVPLTKAATVPNPPATAALAWLFVDLWSSTFFEPMFFWMNSPKIVRETIRAASGRGE